MKRSICDGESKLRSMRNKKSCGGGNKKKKGALPALFSNHQKQKLEILHTP